MYQLQIYSRGQWTALPLARYTTWGGALNAFADLIADPGMRGTVIRVYREPTGDEALDHGPSSGTMILHHVPSPNTARLAKALAETAHDLLARGL